MQVERGEHGRCAQEREGGREGGRGKEGNGRRRDGFSALQFPRSMDIFVRILEGCLYLLAATAGPRDANNISSRSYLPISSLTGSWLGRSYETRLPSKLPWESVEHEQTITWITSAISCASPSVPVSPLTPSKKGLRPWLPRALPLSEMGGEKSPHQEKTARSKLSVPDLEVPIPWLTWLRTAGAREWNVFG